jgi:hypothetical protein
MGFLKQRMQTRLKSFSSCVEIISTHRRDYVNLIVIGGIILVALWGYSGNNTRLIGPPLGNSTGQDYQAISRAAGEVAVGGNPYAHAVAFGRSPNFKEFMSWNVAPYVYPPLVAILMRPLLWLPVDAAFELWTWFNLMLLVGSAVLVAQAFTSSNSGLRAGYFFLALTLFVTYNPIQLDLMLGQIDLLIIFLLILTYFAYYKGYDVGTSATLALAITIKPIVIPLLLFFAWKRRWRIVIIAVLLTGILTIIGFSMIGWAYLPDYIEINRLWSRGPMLAFPFNQSPNGLAIRLFTSNIYTQPLFEASLLRNGLPILVGMLAIGGWLLTVSRTDQPQAPVNRLEYGLTITSLLLISPLVGQNHFTWLVVSLVGLLIVALDTLKEIKGYFLLAVGLLITLYLGYPDLHNAIYHGSEAVLDGQLLAGVVNLLLTGVYLYGLIALNLFLIIYINFLKQRSRREQPSKLRNLKV